MLGERIRLFRVSRGMSLDDLVEAMGGVVTKQALSKYERGIMRPPMKVLNRIAQSLDVRSAMLFAEPEVELRPVGYRKRPSLPVRERQRTENLMQISTEARGKVRHFAEGCQPGAPFPRFFVSSDEDLEKAALALRAEWQIGIDPIPNLTDLLESWGVHVLFVESGDRFEGLSAWAVDRGAENAWGAVVAMRAQSSRFRQRLNLAHSLGHLVLDIPDSMDEEACAYRFAGAFLIPRESLFCDVGRRVRSLGWGELMLLKGRYGVSMQALVRRMKDLEIISPSLYRSWNIEFSKRGFRKCEPGDEASTEIPRLSRLYALRGLREGFLNRSEAAILGGQRIDAALVPDECKTTNLSGLRVVESRKLFAEQADRVQGMCEEDRDLADWEATPLD